MRLKSFIIGDLVYGAVLAAALVALGIGFTLTSSTGEQSKLAYEGDLWCVSNYIEARDSNNQPIYLEDGRPRKDERLDDRTDWIRKEQVAADSAQEAEQIARENAKGLFEPSNATELRAALDNNDEAFFKTHYNEGATSAGPCLGSGWGNGMAGKWVNDGINEDCFGLTSDQGCGFDISKLTLYEDKSSGADPGAKNSQKTEARQYAIEVLGIDASQIKQFPKAEVENMIRAEVARQWAEVSNKYGATQEQAQQAILSYQEHEDSRFQLIGSDGLTSYTLASNSDAAALNIMSLTNDKFDSKNKRIAASYDIKYAIYLGVKENMGAFQSSRVTGEGEQRWKNAIGYVFLPSNPQRYWTDSRSNVAERAWEHYSNETAYVCREIDSGTETPKKPDAPEYCPDKPLETGPSSGEDYQLRLAKQYEQELSKVDGIDSNTSGYDEDAGKTIVEIALQYAPGPDGKTKFKYQINSDGPNTFDCSGFVHYVLKQAKQSGTDVSLGSSSNTSVYKDVGELIHKIDNDKFKTSTGTILRNVNDLPDESILMPGDLLFFGTASSSPGPDQFDPISIGHMGIYIGNGKYIHSTSSDSNPERDSKGRGNQFSQPPIAPMEQGAQYGNYNGVKISSLYDSYFSPQLYIMTRRVVKKQESGVYGQAEGLGRTADPGGKSSSPSFNSCHGSTPCHPSLWPGHNAVIGYGTGKGDAVDISTDGKAYAAFDGTATRHSYGKRSDLIGVRLTSKNGQVIAHYVHVKPTKTGEVKAGEVIGTLYPINSPHIHFELQVNGSVVHGNTSLRGSAYVKSLWSNMRKVLGL